MAARALPFLDDPAGRPAFLTPADVLAFGAAVLVVEGAMVLDECDGFQVNWFCDEGQRRPRLEMRSKRGLKRIRVMDERMARVAGERHVIDSSGKAH